ncbi:FAD-dependent pyridine nucleotide-disulfide oxidoreductase [Penicillium paradoxum]|uniref:FAD-dependent pyridine nucleotide-disulfide oxidoreductase n=1 Tax=Penicillium paradoxum TaxID=176176 RepID=UPI00254971FF|nr:FAD-dependent pyridine nucleotide-disulfide oxidoreductase [Penicillium paradoxum]KAJ5795159.1 FAD-dependent pyridine nucleotide-disulfide oxidoreductase [Penicillium paradoxum]
MINDALERPFSSAPESLELSSPINFYKVVPSLDSVLYEKNPEIGAKLRFLDRMEQTPLQSLGNLGRVAQKYDLRKGVKFQSRRGGAQWNGRLGKWFVQILSTASGEIFEVSADFFTTGTGLLNEYKWSSIPNLQSFKANYSTLHARRKHLKER